MAKNRNGRQRTQRPQEIKIEVPKEVVVTLVDEQTPIDPQPETSEHVVRKPRPRRRKKNGQPCTGNCANCTSCEPSEPASTLDAVINATTNTMKCSNCGKYIPAECGVYGIVLRDGQKCTCGIHENFFKHTWIRLKKWFISLLLKYFK